MKNLCTFLPAFLGTILICSEAETIGLQLVCAASGFALWGAAWLVWQAFEAAERRHRYLRRRAKKEKAPAELALRPGA